MPLCAGCGAELAPSRGTRPRKWCSERCRKQTMYSTPCVDCGAPTNGSNGRGAYERCQACSQRVTAQRQRDRWAPHRRRVEELWAQGLTAREIASIFGWRTKNPGQLITDLRNRGYDLPHRRTPEQLARMRVGADERLAKARAVHAERRAAA